MACVGVGEQRFKWKQGLKLPKGSASLPSAFDIPVDPQFQPSGYENNINTNASSVHETNLTPAQIPGNYAAPRLVFNNSNSTPPPPGPGNIAIQQRPSYQGNMGLPSGSSKSTILPPVGIPLDIEAPKVYPPSLSDGPGPNCKFHWMILLDLPCEHGPSRAMNACVLLFQRLMEHARAPSAASMLAFWNMLDHATKVLELPKAENGDTKFAMKLYKYCELFWCSGGNQLRGYGEDLDCLMRIVSQLSPHDRQIGEDPRNIIVRNALNALATDVLVDTMINSDAPLGPWLYHVSRLSAPQNLLSPNCQIHHYCFNLHVYAMMPKLIRHPSENKDKIRTYYLLSLDSYRHLDLTVTRPVRTPRRRPWPSVAERACHRESQAIRIAISITLNAFLQKWDMLPRERLVEEHSLLCVDAIQLAEQQSTGEAPWPWSAQFIPHSTFAAYCVAQSSTKSRLRQLLDSQRRAPPMWNFLKEAAHWREAPSKLAREIPWFPVHRPRNEPAEKEMAGRKARESMDSFCTVM
ncbi:hypothetical protein C2857_007303 [Epichloe festucae Fl1]|uniref:Uncharacterized protein n=1 Tax=Epichloe festucae (strain Fl1) TaxID=877507 RepID=A0A7S9KQM2_EPIFF|nr:hypothetical protein C2857_007303 [Epichloe festucae Fl1]